MTVYEHMAVAAVVRGGNGDAEPDRGRRGAGSQEGVGRICAYAP